MNKQSITKILFTILISMMGVNAFAYDIEVENADGVTIYYNYINDGKELEVTHVSTFNYEGNYYYRGNVVIPEDVFYLNRTLKVTSIGTSAFFLCIDLISVTIPNSVTSIGNNAFEGCTSLTSLTIGNSVTSIGDDAFSSCRGLISVTIPESVTKIGRTAFSDCSLKSVIIPNSVISIGAYAFSCGLKSVIVGSGVKEMGLRALGGNFKKVIWLTNTPPSGYEHASGLYNESGSINYVSNDQYYLFKNAVKYQFLSSYFDVDGIRYVPVSPSDRTCDAIDCIYDESIANLKIVSTTNYKGVTMNVINIKPYLAYNNTFINTITIDKEGEVPYRAFSDCSNLTNITLSMKVSAIEAEAFRGCSLLKVIDIPDAIMSIGGSAFSSCSALSIAKMGSGIESINSSTFSGCSSLKEVLIGSHVKIIDSNAFDGCNSLNTITIPKSVTDIKNDVFKGCSSLMKVIIADSDTELNLGYNKSENYYTDNYPLFSDCPLDSVYIGRNISYNATIKEGYSPFYRNTSLRAVKITDKETDISENEFYGCRNLQRVIIGDGVTTIGNWAFSGCQSLNYFAFGSLVKTIGKEAFSDCTAVVEISSKAKTPPICDAQALDDINKWNCKLYVPKGCMSVYQAADQWKDFFFTEEGTGSIDPGSGESENKKCAVPTISYQNGKLVYNCPTEGAVCQSTITDSDINSYSGNEIQLGVTYNISAYATKSGYENSDVATATLCWIDVEPKTEGITNSVANVRALPLLIQTNGSTLTVSGADDGTPITIYSINGIEAGSATSHNGAAIIPTTLQSGSVAIVKVGDKSIKVVVK